MHRRTWTDKVDAKEKYDEVKTLAEVGYTWKDDTPTV